MTKLVNVTEALMVAVEALKHYTTQERPGYSSTYYDGGKEAEKALALISKLLSAPSSFPNNGSFHG